MFFPLFIFLLLLLPVIEVYLIFDWLITAPLWAFLYLLATVGGGLFLIKLARFGFIESLARLRTNKLSLSAIPLFGKMWIAGVLLAFPGYISDVIAAIVILLPTPPPQDSDEQKTNITEVQAQVIDEEDENKRQSGD